MGKYSRGLVVALLLSSPVLADGKRPDNSGWWDLNWWNEGVLETPTNLAVKTEWLNVPNDEMEIPALVARPNDQKKYPAVLFLHGRRGLDDLLQLHVKRLAARGFVVFAPDLYNGRFIEKFPLEHDYALEDDAGVALNALLARQDISGRKACVYSHTRGGYYSLKLAVTKERQGKDLACYASYYPHMQDPNAPEPMQVYRHAMEAEAMRIPSLIFIGDQEQYQRRRSIESAVSAMQAKGLPADLIIYPGVGRGFDFRGDDVRTFADDLAAKDAISRATRFMRTHLK